MATSGRSSQGSASGQKHSMAEREKILVHRQRAPASLR
jgi:hypothetical protein